MNQKLKLNSINNNNNNNDTHKFEQLSLDGKLIVKQVALRGYHKYFLETFYLNNDLALTQINIYDAWAKELGMHVNSVNNFIKSALARGWLCELKPIQGTKVETAYVSYKEPDYLPTGQLVYDKRYTYYRITTIGKEVFESNDK